MVQKDTTSGKKLSGEGVVPGIQARGAHFACAQLELCDIICYDVICCVILYEIGQVRLHMATQHTL